MQREIENTAYRELLEPLVCTFHVCRDYRLFLRFSRLNEDIGLNLEQERKNMFHADRCRRRPQVVQSTPPLVSFKVTKKLEELRVGDFCVVCLCPFLMDQNVSCLDCNHLLHHDCLEKWLTKKKNCPICRYEPLN